MTQALAGFDSRKFNATLDRETTSRRSFGNRSKWLFDGAASFKEKLDLIGSAKSTVHIETFILADDASGRTLARLLCAKVKEGVKVRFLYDAWGTELSADALLAELRARGVEVRAYHPRTDIGESFHRLHGKQIIVDGKVAVDGGRNFADEYNVSGRLKNGSTGWRDTDMETVGPAVRADQDSFLRDWEISGARVSKVDRSAALPALVPVKGGAAVRVVSHHPDEDGDDDIGKLYVAAIRSSHRSINITSAYFIPTQEVRDALIDRAVNGVKVRILTNSYDSSDVKVVSLAARHYYPELLEAGVEIHESKKQTVHAKTASFDGELAVAGSANLDGMSLHQNIEIDEAVEDKTVAVAHDVQFESDLKMAEPVTQKKLDDRPWYSKLATEIIHLVDSLL